MKVKRIAAFFLCLFFAVTSAMAFNESDTARPAENKTTNISASVKDFWKTNELLIGISLVALTVGIVFFVWRKRKDKSGPLL